VKGEIARFMQSSAGGFR